MGRKHPVSPAAPLGTLAVVVTIAGCGSSVSNDRVSAGRYVKSVCTAVAPFENDVRTRSGKLSQGSLSTLADDKHALQSFLSGVDSDTASALSKLKAAGMPNVPNGKAISSSLVGSFQQLKVAMDHAAGQAKSLSTSDPQSFRAGAESVALLVRSSLNGIGYGLQGLRSAELQQAAAQQPECIKLGA